MNPERSANLTNQQKAAIKSWNLSPEKKAVRVSKIQNENRKAGLRKAWAGLSDDEKISKMELVKSGNRRKREERMEKALGENPVQALQDLVNKGLSVSEISTKVGQDVGHWLKEGNLRSCKRTVLERAEIEYRQGLVHWGEETGKIKGLLPDDRWVLDVRYLSDEGGKVVPLDLIGQQRGLSKERVRQQDARGLTKLRKMRAVDGV